MARDFYAEAADRFGMDAAEARFFLQELREVGFNPNVNTLGPDGVFAEVVADLVPLVFEAFTTPEEEAIYEEEGVPPESGGEDDGDREGYTPDYQAPDIYVPDERVVEEVLDAESEYTLDAEWEYGEDEWLDADVEIEITTEYEEV